MVSVKDAVLVILPLVAVTVTVVVPAIAVPPCTVSVEPPLPPLTEGGTKPPEAPAGNPLTVNPTAEVNPFNGEIV